MAAETPAQILIRIIRLVGFSVTKIGTSDLYVIRLGRRRVAILRDEWSQWNADPPA